MNDILICPNPHSLNLSVMRVNVSSPIHQSEPPPTSIETVHNDESTQNTELIENRKDPVVNGSEMNENSISNGSRSDPRKSRKENTNKVYHIVRRERPSRACTVRAAQAKLYVEQPVIERKTMAPKKVKNQKIEELEEEEPKEQCSKVVTPLLNEPSQAQLPRWNLRSMWELASILNFFNVFRPLLNITVEFTAEELETALLTPNITLGDIHIPLLKSIPPVTRMACGRDTWITVLCRKLRDWWIWVAEGEVPIVASHGEEIEAYKLLDPGFRVKILKALCDIRVEQEDIRSYIDNSIKHGAQLSVFRKERIGGDSKGISYWYEDDPTIGHRLYREIRKVEVKEVKNGKTNGSLVLPSTTYEWQAVATNLDEFLDVSEKLFVSKNQTEVSLGKKLKNDMLPEIEKEHKRRERLLKKQQRQALMLDNFVAMDGLAGGRSLRDRKPVTYTFDDFDRSINEAIKITKKKQPSPESTFRREPGTRPEPTMNGRWNGPFHVPQDLPSSVLPSTNYDEFDEDSKPPPPLDCSNRRRQRPQRYSEKGFVEELSENEQEDFDSDDDIVGEAVYDEEYLRKRKRVKRLSSCSEGDDEYQWSDENIEEEQVDMSSMSEDSDKSRSSKKMPSCPRRETKLRSVGELQTGLRCSRRSTRNRMDYRQYEMSESDTECVKREKANVSYQNSDASDHVEECLMGSPEKDYSEGEEEDDREEAQQQHPIGADQPPFGGNGYDPDTSSSMAEKEQEGKPTPAGLVNSNSPSEDEGGDEVGKDGFLTSMS